MASSVATPLERQFGHIAGIAEMTSTSYLGSTSIALQFDLSRNVDAAARDVQAAINAARGNLPANLPSNPTYRKVNPADAPVLILSVTSDIYNQAQMYDAASSILQQKIAQVDGVGQVLVGGSSLPAVRVELNPAIVNKYGISMDSIRSTLAAANANIPKGELADAHTAMTLYTTDQLLKADQYKPLIVAYRNGAPVRVSDLGDCAGFRRRSPQRRRRQRQAGRSDHHFPPAGSQHHRNGGPLLRGPAPAAGLHPAGHAARRSWWTGRPRSAPRSKTWNAP